MQKPKIIQTLLSGSSAWDLQTGGAGKAWTGARERTEPDLLLTISSPSVRQVPSPPRALGASFGESAGRVGHVHLQTQGTGSGGLSPCCSEASDPGKVQETAPRQAPPGSPASRILAALGGRRHLEKGGRVLSAEGQFADRIFGKWSFGRNWKHLRNVDGTLLGAAQPGSTARTLLSTLSPAPFLPLPQPRGAPVRSSRESPGRRATAGFENGIISQLFWSLDCLSSDGGFLLPPAWPDMAPTPRPVLGTRSGPFPTVPLPFPEAVAHAALPPGRQNSTPRRHTLGDTEPSERRSFLKEVFAAVARRSRT